MTYKTPDRMVRLAQVIELTGLSRSSIYAAIQRGEFPRNYAIGSRAKAWREAEVLQWLRDRGIPIDPESGDVQPVEPAPKIRVERPRRVGRMYEVVAVLPEVRGSKRRR